MRSIVLMGLMALAAAGFAADQAGTRGILPEDVVQAHPKTKVAAPLSKSAAPSSRPVYKSAGNQAMQALRAGLTACQVGVAIWRLRPAGAGDNRGVRLLVQEDAGSAERVAQTSALHSGDRVRVTIESPEAGYLYVVDRERCASGERGAPYLIFPTLRTRGGDNEVAAGKLVEIPGQEDRPNFFSLKPSRADQVEEELTILLVPKPIEGLEIGEQAVRIQAEMAAGWER
jgi:hypothetical protein